MAMVTVGIDLAKNVFAVHGVDESGKPAPVRRDVPQVKLLERIANLPTCLLGIAAYSGAHGWGRDFSNFGDVAAWPGIQDAGIVGVRSRCPHPQCPAVRAGRRVAMRRLFAFADSHLCR